MRQQSKAGYKPEDYVVELGLVYMKTTIFPLRNRHPIPKSSEKRSRRKAGNEWKKRQDSAKYANVKTLSLGEPSFLSERLSSPSRGEARDPRALIV